MATKVSDKLWMWCHPAGCYMWGFGVAGHSMPLEMMEVQCKKGLEWLGNGRIKGMIFLASCICDLELEAVEWTRKWMKEVKNMDLR